MARSLSRYDSACYYAGKLMGRCTVADGNAYTQFMKDCENSAMRVLCEYTYFSTELKGILEKVAAIQVKEARKAGVFLPPKDSPWDKVQHCRELCSGIFMVSTAGHGGIMVAKEVVSTLSPAARKCGFQENGYLCFEEDCAACVVLRELLDRTPQVVPDYIEDIPEYENCIDRSLQRYNPVYWASRARRLKKAAQCGQPMGNGENECTNPVATAYTLLRKVVESKDTDLSRAMIAIEEAIGFLGEALDE